MVSDFRRVLEQMLHGDGIHFSNGKDGVFLDTLNTMEQMSDSELLEAKLYADLGMDSIEVWEMVCIFERDFGVWVADDIETALGTGVTLTVRSFLGALNSYQC